MLTLRTDFGCTEAIIDDDCGIKKFYEIASILTDNLDIKFKVTADEADTQLWHFPYNKNVLSLHYNVYTGISIFPGKFREASKQENEAVVEIARQLEKILNNSSSQYLS
jgi:hypothetical protein